MILAKKIRLYPTEEQELLMMHIWKNETEYRQQNNKNKNCSNLLVMQDLSITGL